MILGSPIPSPSFHSCWCVPVFRPLLWTSVSTECLPLITLPFGPCSVPERWICPARWFPPTLTRLSCILETGMKVWRDSSAFTRARQSYFKAACDTSPSACPQSYSATRVLPLPAPSFFCSTTPLSNSSPAVQGSLTFSLVSWFPLYLLALTAFILAVYQSFSQHTFIPEEEFWCPLLNCLISPVTGCFSHLDLPDYASCVPQNSLLFSFLWICQIPKFDLQPSVPLYPYQRP